MTSSTPRSEMPSELPSKPVSKGSPPEHPLAHGSSGLDVGGALGPGHDEDGEPVSSSATSASLVLSGSGEIAPLKSLEDLDSKTLAALFDDVSRHEKIVQWFSIGGSALLMGSSLGSAFGLIPSGMVYVSLAASAISLASTLGYLLSRQRHWRRECAELGMSKSQTRALRSRLYAARRQLRKGRMSDEEWHDQIVQHVLNRFPALTDGKGKEAK